MGGCQHLHGYRAGERLDGLAADWATWTEYECTREEGCPFLDDNVECPVKENIIGNIHRWAINHVAGKDGYTRAQELMVKAEAGGGISEAQLRYLFKKMIYEFLDEHFYDAKREFAWYTGWWPSLHEPEEVDRKDGAIVIYSDEPFIKVSEEAIRELLGIEAGEEE